jgi:hypothetical protein
MSDPITLAAIVVTHDNRVLGFLSVEACKAWIDEHGDVNGPHEYLDAYKAPRWWHPQRVSRLKRLEELGVPFFFCRKCGAASYNWNDAKEGYCGKCHDWTGPQGGLPLDGE